MDDNVNNKHFHPASKFWVDNINILRKMTSDANGDDSSSSSDSDSDSSVVAETAADPDPDAEEEFQLVRRPTDPDWSHRIALDTCHGIAMDVLYYFELMDKYWDDALANIDKAERDQILGGLRCNFPLVVTSWDGYSRALVAEPQGRFPDITPHPRGHGMVEKNTYEYGVIKINEALLAELENQQRLKLVCDVDDEVTLPKLEKNVRILRAALFYTFVFELADLLAAQNYWGSNYGSKGMYLPEGWILQVVIFNGALQLWKNKDREYKLVVDVDDTLVVLDDVMACRPMYFMQSAKEDDSLDKFGLVMPRAGSAALAHTLQRPILTVYSPPAPLHDARRWYWEEAWNRCRNGVPGERFSVKVPSPPPPPASSRGRGHVSTRGAKSSSSVDIGDERTRRAVAARRAGVYSLFGLNLPADHESLFKERISKDSLEDPRTASKA